MIVVFDVECQKQQIDYVGADADDAKVFQHKVENVGQVDVAQVGQHAERYFEAIGARIISEQNQSSKNYVINIKKETNIQKISNYIVIT